MSIENNNNELKKKLELIISMKGNLPDSSTIEAKDKSKVEKANTDNKDIKNEAEGNNVDAERK